MIAHGPSGGEENREPPVNPQIRRKMFMRILEILIMLLYHDGKPEATSE
jgi:hypothetical protein